MVKDKKYLEKIASFCLDHAIKNGVTDCEISVSNTISESVTVRNKKIESSDQSNNLSIGITTYIGNKKSNVSSSNLSEKEISTLVERCVEMTKVTPEDPYVCMPKKEGLAKKELDLHLFDDESVTTENKINFLKEMENEAFKNDKIINSNGSSFSVTKSNFILANTLGFCKGYKTSNFGAACAVVAQDQNVMETDYDFSQKRFYNDLKNAKKIGFSAAERATNRLGAKKIASTKLPIIFDKRVSKNLLSSFASAVSGSSFSRGTSFLKEKLKKEIFSKKINIYDNPLIKKGLGSQFFDSEGVESNKVQIIKEGVLEQIFLDTYHARILKMKTNGRCGGSTNLYFENGEISVEKIINDQKKAIYITDLIGRGSDTITGDYSIGASGIMIERGELTTPVNEITIAGNLIDMFKNLTLANDMELIYSVNAPSILVENMTIAGK